MSARKEGHKSKKGVATPKSEIDLIEKRLKDLIKEKEGRP
jgi:phage-related protein